VICCIGDIYSYTIKKPFENFYFKNILIIFETDFIQPIKKKRKRCLDLIRQARQDKEP